MIKDNIHCLTRSYTGTLGKCPVCGRLMKKDECKNIVRTVHKVRATYTCEDCGVVSDFTVDKDSRKLEFIDFEKPIVA